MLIPPVPITLLGPTSAATVTFRSRGLLHLTAIVKATFALAPEARMTPLLPDPIFPAEIPDPSGRGLRTAGDLAPYLGETDVLLTGHAEVLPTFSATELCVWLALVRDGVVRIDRWLDLDPSARVGPARGHVHIHGAGPLSREWPRRSQLLEGVDPQRLHGPLVDIPEGFDWSYFQAAPAEQRMELLQGDEWLVLGGIYAQRPKLRTQLPAAQGIARLYRRGEALPRVGVPIPLVADTLVIDVDRRCVSILWRGHVPVEEAELASLQIVAGVELAGREVVCEDPFPGEDFGVETVLVPLESAKKLAAAPATPFVRPAESTVQAESALEGTFVIPDDVARKLAMAVATPFEKPVESAPGAEDFGTSTLVGSSALALKLAAGPATPFKSHWDAPLPRFKSAAVVDSEEDEERETIPPLAHSISRPEAENRLVETFVAPLEVARKLVGQPATPFERSVVVLPVQIAPPVEIAPPVQIAPPALLIITSEEANAEPEGLGDAFLAAMVASEELA